MHKKSISPMNYAILILALGCAPLLPLVATGYFWYSRWKCRKVVVGCGLKGREAALRLLAENGITDIPVGPANEMIGDHFDPKDRKIALSADVLDQSSAFALAVAAHEVGHALQQKEGYRWFGWWMAVAPYVHLLTFAFQVIVLCLAMFFPPIIFLLVISYSLLFLMSVLTLPVEYDASRRALKELDRSGLLTTPEEKSAAKTVLVAAGLTYVAKAIQDLVLAVYYALRTFRH
jgi:Zn-dependent membrane protease YugP